MSAQAFGPSRCHKCGRDTDTAPALPALAVCEDCCEDHGYRYVPEAREHRCVHCDRPAPPEWYEE